MSERTSEVVKHLDLAVQAAEKQNMSASQIIGMFFYYAHNLSQQARETALQGGGEDHPEADAG